MKEILQIVFTAEEIENLVREAINGFVPKEASISYNHNTEWKEITGYNKANKDCIMIEFTKEDVEKEMKENQKKVEEGGEQAWSSNEEVEGNF